MSNAFVIPIELRWRDLDAFNHLNNATYLSLLEEARIRWFAQLGEPWVTEEFAPVVASSTLNYRAPVNYPATLQIELFSERIGETSVVIGHRIKGEDGRVHCDGNVVAVWINVKSGKPRALPEGVRRAAERLVG
ncbi:acyl-CoA thioesterase [Solilutibacter silvestris]|uniref:Putative thioesterase n=1 Tax=Solilutibacter silvestris TaxID=1645665 RepID=A0A2K1PYD7_9GAMM|nr:thioesterase family protein [Lysobacter silvestris]PNS07697.1 putative thioesterase [Lysobacter silvestris]